ncbi:MAG: DUF4199 domain-containing protein [Saprospiraceae bacterium]
MENLDSPTTMPASAPPPYWNNVLKYGLYGGVALIVFSLLTYLMDMNMTSIMAGLLAFAVMLSVAVGTGVIAIQNQRTLDGGYMAFGRAFVIGALAIAVAVFLSNIWNFLLITVIDPDYMNRIKEQFVEQWGDNMPEEAMNEVMKGFDEAGSLGTAAKNLVTGILLNGLIGGLIAAAIGKKSPPMNL